MAKVIAETTQEQASAEKLVEIKHTRSAVDAAGKTVDIVDYTEVKTVDQAISQAEAQKASIEASLAEVDAELADYIAIRDAE